MKLNVISDLHVSSDRFGTKIDWMGFDPSKLAPADYLIVAGDLGIANINKLAMSELKKATAGKFKKIIYCLGNHDYWTFPDLMSSLTTVSAAPACPSTPNDKRTIVEDGDIVILACTLWTPIPENCRKAVRSKMNDFRYISGFDIDRQNEIYSDDVFWLKKNMEKYAGKKIVVVTHHNPYIELIPSSYLTSDMTELNPAYTVINGSCDNIRPDVWICGHIHEPFDETLPIGAKLARCVRNPIGYRFGMYSPANPECSSENWYDKIVEV